mmetsp:Transcript_5391/g.6578  ORF Transcript_5391/g.6578 Transcript_5391/m.6578 type:complete len:207 (-) Transcript_5391:287-907(-)
MYVRKGHLPLSIAFCLSLRDGDWVVSSKTSATPRLGGGITVHHRILESLPSEVGQAVYSNLLRDALDVFHAVGDKLLRIRKVHPKEAGVFHRRGGAAEVHFLRSVLADKANEPRGRCPSDDGVVYNDHDRVLHNALGDAEFPPHFERAVHLPRGDEGASDVVVADEPQVIFAFVSQLLTLSSVSERSSVCGSWYGNDNNFIALGNR